VVSRHLCQNRSRSCALVFVLSSSHSLSLSLSLSFKRKTYQHDRSPWTHGRAACASSRTASAAHTHIHGESFPQRESHRPLHQHRLAPPSARWQRILGGSVHGRHCSRGCAQDGSSAAPLAAVQRHSVRPATGTYHGDAGEEETVKGSQFDRGQPAESRADFGISMCTGRM
jgi:hypothetical protein